MTDRTPNGRRLLTGSTGIVVLTAAMAAWSVGGYVAVVNGFQQPEPAHHIPIWLLAALFLTAESSVVHLQFRRGAHTLAMSEIPIVVGLVLATPSELVVAHLTGSILALVLSRPKSVPRFAFNVANYAASMVTALVVYSLVASGATRLDERGWLTVAVAVAAYVAVNSTTVAIAVSLSDGEVDVRRLGFTYLMVFGCAATNLALGLVTTTIISYDPTAAWLLLAPAVTVFLAYRAYVRERQKHDSLEFLYESTRIVTENPDLEEAVVALLKQARSMFRGEIAEALISSPHSASMLRTRIDTTGEARVMEAIDDPEMLELARLLAAMPSTQRLSAAGDDTAVERYLAKFELQNAMVAPLRGERRAIGILVVGDRTGAASSAFQKQDMRLFEALADHVTVALENGRLEQSLAQLRELEQQLTQLAFHDPLTGLANRALFSERVTEALVKAKSDGRTCAVLFIDLDDFKTVNDTLGHEAGDKLLTAVAQRITACLRPSDQPARLGGDEFAVLIEDALSLQAAERIAARITDALRLPVRVNEADLHVRASIGIATSQEVASADEMLRNADLAMYMAKSDGKGRYRWFRSSMRADVVRRHQLKSDLERAADRGEFQVHYQPIVDLRSGRPVAAEALVRWVHPDRGLIFPASFIPTAERSGLINEIGRFVLRSACRDTADWQRACPGIPQFAVTVNLSPAQFQQPDLVAEVEEAVDDAGIDPGHLILEITEGLMLQGSERVVRTLDRLSGLGVRLAMDDFGTGYASLASLRELPMDIIKIAKTFTDDISGNEEKSPFVRAMIELGEALRLTTLAEGIETAQQARELERLGCQLGQGYHFARPVPASGIEVLLRRHFEKPQMAKVIAFPA